MKIYDKEIYNKQKSISSIVTILAAFIIGFAGGFLASSINDNGSAKNEAPQNVVNTNSDIEK